jgi:hypothetical protein
MQSLVNAMTQLGNISAVIIVGILSDDNDFLPIIILTLPLSLLPVFFILAGWLPEPYIPVCCGKHNLIEHPDPPNIVMELVRNSDNIETKAELPSGRISQVLRISLPILTSIGSCVIALSVMFINDILAFVLIGIIISILLVGSFFAFNKPIAKVILFRFLASLSYININGALDYFLLADPICNPNGPYFSYKYFVTYTGIVAAILSFLGAAFYPLLFGKLRYRNVIIMTTLLYPVAGLFDLTIVKRWNVFIGIPDYIFYMLGSSILYNLVDMLSYIPLSAIISKHCSKGYETTTYGYVAGVSAISYGIASILGSYLIDWLNIVTIPIEGLNCDFSKLWILVLATHIIAPILLLFPFVFILIQD